MFGFAFAAACLASFFVVQRGGFRRHHHRFHHVHRGGGFFRAVDPRPEQRDALASVLKDLRSELAPLAEVFHRSKAAVAEALRGDDPASPSLDAAFEMHREALETLHRSLADAFAKVHGILDPDQRERLSRALEKGRGPFRGARFVHGPYR